MSIRSKAEKLLASAGVVDVQDGTLQSVFGDAEVEALREALKERSPAEVVEDINSDSWTALFEEGKEHWNNLALQDLAVLTYHSNGTSEWIEFLGFGIWDDQDNGIPWDDAKDEPTFTLRDHLLNEMGKVIESLAPLATFCASQLPTKVGTK